MRLNLGCGGQIIAGWVNVDRDFAGVYTDPSRIYVHDLRDPWPWDTDSIDYAVAHHFLDLLDAHELLHVLSEAQRVLMPGGVLRISSIDVQRCFAAVADGNRGWFHDLGVPELRAPFLNDDDEVCLNDDLVLIADWWLEWNGARRSILTPKILTRLLERAGFAVDYCDFETTTTLPAILELDSREDESYFLEARKLDHPRRTQ